MAQSKLNDLANKFSKGPTGLNVGFKVVAAAGLAAYGISQSMYTGMWLISFPIHIIIQFNKYFNQ